MLGNTTSHTTYVSHVLQQITIGGGGRDYLPMTEKKRFASNHHWGGGGGERLFTYD